MRKSILSEPMAAVHSRAPRSGKAVTSSPHSKLGLRERALSSGIAPWIDFYNRLTSHPLSPSPFVFCPDLYLDLRRDEGKEDIGYRISDIRYQKPLAPSEYHAKALEMCCGPLLCSYALLLISLQKPPFWSRLTRYFRKPEAIISRTE